MGTHLKIFSIVSSFASMLPGERENCRKQAVDNQAVDENKISCRHRLEVDWKHAVDDNY